MKWEDAYSTDGNPIEHEDIINPSCLLEEIGFWIHETDSWLVMAREISHEDMNYRFAMTIPKAIIVSRKWLG